MNLTFTNTSDFLNTAIIDTSNGIALYQTESHSIVNKVTTIRRVMPGTVHQVIAEIHWGTLTLNSAKVHYRGREMRNRDFLVKSDIFGDLFHRYRVFVGMDGRQYRWKLGFANKFTLLDYTEAPVAESHRAHLGLFGKPTKFNMDVSNTIWHILDDVIVSFIIFANDARRQGNSDAAVLININTTE